MKIRRWNDFKNVNQFSFLIYSPSRTTLSYIGQSYTSPTQTSGINIKSFEDDKRLLRLSTDDIIHWGELGGIAETGEVFINPDVVLEYNERTLKVRIRTLYAYSSWITLKNNDNAKKFLENIKCKSEV